MRIRLAAMAMTAGLVACGGTGGPASTPPEAPADQPVDRVSIAPPELAPEIRRRLDEGNAAFEAGDLEAAQGHYEAALEVDSTSAPAWFGLYMTLVELGENERAASAAARVQAVATPPPGDPHAGGAAMHDTLQREGGA